MSYIERATYDYIIKILSEGIRVLFSKRFILFTLLLIISGLLSAFVTSPLTGIDFDKEAIEIVFLLQAATSISFIVAGIFAKRLLSTFKRFLLLIIVIITISLVGVLSSSSQMNIEPIRLFLLEYYPIFCLIAWTLFMPIAGFGFAKGMFYNKVTGSILFLGKPEDDHNAIFALVLALITLIGIGGGIFLVLERDNTFIQFYGIITIILSILVFLSVFGKFFHNAALNSALGVFFIASALPGMISITLSSSQDPGVGAFTYLLLIFSLIYTAQGQAKRASREAGMSEEEIRLTQAKEKFDEKIVSDPFGISRTLSFLGAEGIVFIFLGTFLGYNLLHLEYYNGFNDLFLDLFSDVTVGQLYQVISILFVVFMFIFIFVTYYLYPSARKYFKADLIRLSFLPNYDEMKAYITAVQRGEITKKDMTADAVKLVGSQLAKKIKQKGIFRRLFGSSDDNKG
ncbi:MAG: hypothetical protein ACXAC7_12970 [Candidatus Hodarchaeales archaeon]|jgi:hypothetical protein